ncbi:MAG: DUF262 domain-containing protein [Fermentimonas sp.]|nr:DUF262 domain-containing protein [Fermentimonas sp.]
MDDLLNDIDEFIEKSKINNQTDSFYCIQPLVVKEIIVNKEEYLNKLNDIKIADKDLLSVTKLIINEHTRWEVIDGQQRLTAIKILLTYLDESDNKYYLEYETRNDSKLFLENIDEGIKEENIDYYHIATSKDTIEKWFIKKLVGKDENQQNIEKNTFKSNILNNVKFIWYESVDENPIKVFTRLNIYKIALTNAELIKALFLNCSHFKNNEFQKLRLKQGEIASQWDNIEYTLQNDEFWLFLNKKEYNKPTRIDFLFELIYEQDSLELFKNKEEKEKVTGTDKYKTFRYFDHYFKGKDVEIENCWIKTKSIYQIFQEWYNDLELFHYVGYLIELEKPISVLLKEWKEKVTKEDFINILKEYIKSELSKCYNLNKEYEIEEKTKCRPLLLLHNIQTVINQNKSYKNNADYKLPIFYKFPFHLYKSEKWDVEHIDSNTENDLSNISEQKEWLKYSSIGLNNEDLKEKIKQFIKLKDGEETETFKVLLEEIEKERNIPKENKLTETEKNKIWNFTLLDASTNRSYGNSIFPAKRRVIIGKDQGKRLKVDDNLIITEDKETIAFIPPCTKNVFTKYYNPTTNNLREWDKNDAKEYRANIKETLKDFGIIDS